MMQRHGAHGAGTWSVPGGNLEFGEAFQDTARREVQEETGLTITNIRFGGITNDFFEADGKHYITIWLTSDWVRGEPTIMEPEKCLKQEWRTFDTLASPLFMPCWNNLLTSEFIDTIKSRAIASLATKN